MQQLRIHRKSRHNLLTHPKQEDLASMIKLRVIVNIKYCRASSLLAQLAAAQGSTIPASQPSTSHAVSTPKAKEINSKNQKALNQVWEQWVHVVFLAIEV